MAIEAHILEDAPEVDLSYADASFKPDEIKGDFYNQLVAVMDGPVGEIEVKKPRARRRVVVFPSSQAPEEEAKAFRAGDAFAAELILDEGKNELLVAGEPVIVEAETVRKFVNALKREVDKLLG